MNAVRINEYIKKLESVRAELQGLWADNIFDDLHLGAENIEEDADISKIEDAICEAVTKLFHAKKMLIAYNNKHYEN